MLWHSDFLLPVLHVFLGGNLNIVVSPGGVRLQHEMLRMSFLCHSGVWKQNGSRSRRDLCVHAAFPRHFSDELAHFNSVEL